MIGNHEGGLAISELNLEKEVLNKKNRQGLKGVDAPLREQVPQKLREKLIELKIGEKVAKLWQIGNANRTNFLERQREFLASWDEFLVSSAEGPFNGSSNLHLPMPLIVAKTMHARFMQALRGMDPPFLIKSRTEGNKDRASMITEFMNYAIKEWCNEHRGIDEPLDRWVWDWLTSGSGVLKERWLRKFEKFIDVEDVIEAGPPIYSTDQNGQRQMKRMPVKKEKEVTKTIKVFEGPVFEQRSHEDVLIIGGGGDPQLADSVTDRYFLTADEIWQFVDQKIFDEEAARVVIGHGPDYPAGAIASEIKVQKAVDAGKAAIRTTVELDRYEILETYIKLDVDGDGINSEIVTWTHYRSRELLHANYLRRMNKSGERPLFKIDFHLRPQEEFGVGIVEMMYPLSVELDAIHNMRIDFGLLATMPFGFYRSTSSINPEILSLEPGALIPLDNPTSDVYFPNLGNRTAVGFQEEEALQVMIQRLTGINDMNQGVVTGAQGATRTATGAQALLGESNANLDVHLRRLNKGWKDILKYTLHQFQQRLEPGFVFRVLGEDGNDYWKTIKDREEIAGDYDFEVSPNSAQSNQQIQEQIAESIVQLTANPLDIQLGIIGPGQRYEALKNWFKVKGIKDYGRFCQAPQGYTYSPSPEEEANRILRGIDVPVLPNMDHQGFIDYFQHIHDDDNLLGQFSQVQTHALAAQALKHKNMMDALQQQQAAQNNASQMQMNAQRPQAQLQPGGGAFAGNAPTPAIQNQQGPPSTPNPPGTGPVPLKQ